jgi:hypothetical protein
MPYEEWLPIPGYEGVYEASCQGRVRRTLACKGATAGRVLSQFRSGDYLAVWLYREDRRKKIGVHVLVCAAFYGRPPYPYMQVNHKDCTKQNNKPSNLEWVTHQANVVHAVANGRAGGRPLPGESNGRSKLTASQVAQIRGIDSGVGPTAIARQFGVSKTAIQHIRNRKNWAHV